MHSKKSKGVFVRWKRFTRIIKPRKYLDELDEKIRKLDKYYHDDKTYKICLNHQLMKTIINQH